MCFNKETSIGALALGTLTSYMLTQYGKKEYDTSNKIIGYFFMYVTLMQLVDYLIWSDISCTNGLNKFAGYIGPILNHLQPTVLFLLCNKYLKCNIHNTGISKFNIYANIAYVMYTMIMYSKYISKDQLCSNLQNGKHVHWAWKRDFNYIIYQMMMLFNLVMFLGNKLLMVSMIISYILFFISFKYYNTNIGELWCYFVIYIPLIILIWTHLNSFEFYKFTILKGLLNKK